tara:strand:+ start:314 stop:655 length:342 start_codon:yes stop_codon:yes gene_type:complete
MGRKSELEELFAGLWRRHGKGWPKPEREARLIEGHRFRADFFWPTERVAVEIEGGTWIGGRHSRGSGYQRDCEKYNLYVISGVRLLRFTGDMLRKDEVRCMEQVKELLENRGG